MNTFSIVLTVAVVFLIMASVIHSLFQKLKDLKKVVKELECELANKEINISYLVKHSQELASILQNNTEIQNKISQFYRQSLNDRSLLRRKLLKIMHF